jgi:hypothetical protein
MKVITEKALIPGSILAAVTNWKIQEIEVTVSIMTPNRLKTEIEPSRVGCPSGVPYW